MTEAKPNVLTNWLLLAALVVFVALAACFVDQNFYPFLGDLLPGETVTEEGPQTPEQIIEAQGSSDVIYFAYEPENGPDKTPKIGIGLLWYAPNPLDVDKGYHIELTPEGYNRVFAPYDWSPDMDEPLQDKYNLWNWEKFYYYKNNALFKPGEFSRVIEPLSELSTWYSRKVLCEFIYAVMEAAMTIEDEWAVIEVDILALQMPVDSYGVDENGEPIQSVITFPESLTSTIIIWRRRWIMVDVESDNRRVARKVDHIVAEGELHYEELDEMFAAHQLSIEPARSMWGWRTYTRGKNCEWQGREIKMLKIILAAAAAEQAEGFKAE